LYENCYNATKKTNIAYVSTRTGGNFSNDSGTEETNFHHDTVIANRLKCDISTLRNGEKSGHHIIIDVRTLATRN